MCRMKRTKALAFGLYVCSAIVAGREEVEVFRY